MVWEAVIAGVRFCEVRHFADQRPQGPSNPEAFEFRPAVIHIGLYIVQAGAIADRAMVC